jgi:Flp pilus assembly protein TadG
MTRKGIKATAMIEFALIAPLLIIIIFGFIEMGIMFYDKTVISDASRQGARYGTIKKTNYPSTASVETYTQSYCSNRLISFSATPPTVSVTATASGPQQFGSNLTVTVQYTYTDYVIHNFLNVGQTHLLTATTVMPYE